MAITNRDRVGKALEILGLGLAPFVERELKAVLNDKWQEALSDNSPKTSKTKKAAPVKLSDPHLLLAAMWNRWNDVFARTLGHAERSLVSELRDVRNRWAHSEAFSGHDAYRTLD